MIGTGPSTALMAGKRGLIMGVANDHSISWGIAKTLAAHGAELAFTYQGAALGKRVKPLAESVGSRLVIPCDVEEVETVDTALSIVAEAWGGIDFLVHGIAYSDRTELKGRYADTSRGNFVRTMVISAFSFTEVAKRAAAYMPKGGSLLTLTFGGSTRVTPNYNVMGVAKSALEASVRYLAADFGAGEDPGQRDFGRSDPDPGRGGHLGRPVHVQLFEGAQSLAPDSDDRGCRRLGPLPAVRPVAWRYRRNSFRRRGLQFHRHAPLGRPEVG